MHGFGSRDDIPPPAFRRISREQFHRYPNVEVRNTRVGSVEPHEEAFRVALGDGTTVAARRILLAVGMVDVLMDIPGCRERWGTISSAPKSSSFVWSCNAGGSSAFMKTSKWITTGVGRAKVFIIRLKRSQSIPRWDRCASHLRRLLCRRDKSPRTACRSSGAHSSGAERCTASSAQRAFRGLHRESFATMDPSPGEREDPSPRLANLQRAALYPWTDDGHCVVREASNEWPILAERCFHALDRDRVRFRDVTRKCAVASAPAAAAVPAAVALCIFASPAVVTGAVVVIGAVVVAAAIQEGINTYQRNAARERAKPKTQTRPSSQQEPVTKKEPKPEGLGRDWLPPASSDPTERPECKPIPVRHAGEDIPHNECADKFPPNRYPGMDIFVAGQTQCQACFDVCWKTGQWLAEIEGDPCLGGPQ
ncbi:DUF6310 domain-containing protein [Stigmatella sp. ncwal1]|uniref:DUF6310 domain-containing protein n=1 Tax=Stigmatella ashevillensis TaxID=2995309 RepID=A0ABT5D495_9BACT|nr:DUF6310 domain-containing protein [Stigmatella ashevillena]MDC0707953.1 DUF6310 domain-containing protein [Stigmatella ashevillena]